MATQKGRNWSSGDIVTAANLSSIERGVSAVAEEYTPTTWANGDTVTAAALNKIEQGIANAGGGGSWTVLFEGSVTTEKNEGETNASGDIFEAISLAADSIKVTFNGVEYTCEAYTPQGAPSGIIAYGSPYADGEPTFDGYPFWILNNGMIKTPNAGTYTLKIEAPAGGGSSDFSTAQVTLVNGGMITLPVTQEADPSQGAPAYLMVVGQALEAGTYSVPLYKGGLIVNLPSGTSVSGNIQHIGVGYFITGDCTITILKGDL